MKRPGPGIPESSQGSTRVSNDGLVAEVQAQL